MTIPDSYESGQEPPFDKKHFLEYYMKLLSIDVLRLRGKIKKWKGCIPECYRYYY